MVMKNDFVFLSNLLGKTSQIEFKISQGNPNLDAFYKPQLLEFNDTFIGSLIALDTLPDECISKSGIVKARKQFLEAVKYAVDKLEVKVILLAASTKRLFGKEIELKVNWEGQLDDDGFTLRELYPYVIFTNGDNGTANVLDMEVESILQADNIIPECADSCGSMNDSHQCSGSVIINGLGLLGTNSLLHLIENNYCDNQVIVISNHTKELTEIIGNRKVKVYSHINEIKDHCCLGENNHVKMIVNCTHHPTQMISANSISHIKNGKPLHVIDVAVPYGFPEEEYGKCSNVIRQDGGNAYVEHGLEYFFNPEICGLTENVIYGCFAETMCLAAYLKENPNKKEYVNGFDFFNVNKKTKDFVKGLFINYGIGISPKPYNYMKQEPEDKILKYREIQEIV